MLTDYGKLAPEQRNILRLIFCNPGARAAQADWESVAQFVVAAFRADAVRAGQAKDVEALVEDLSRLSPDFRRIWADNDVQAHGEGTKYLRHPVAGPIGMEYSAFSVDGRPDLGMVIYNPSTPEDAQRIRLLISTQLMADSASNC